MSGPERGKTWRITAALFALTSPERAQARKTTISVLLALVTVTGAMFVWRSLVLGEDAIDADRRSVLETVLVEQNRVNAEVGAEMDAVSAARHEALRAEEAALEQGARLAREEGLT